MSDILNGRYELHKEIGRGSMGVVYHANDTKLIRAVAIKVLTTELSLDPVFVERFHRELAASAKLDHPNIVHVYDVGVDNGRSYYVMQLIQGSSLRDVMGESAQLPVELVLKIISQVGEALDYAHKAGIIHGNLKPSNILIDTRRNVSVADFGITRLADGTGMKSGFMGSPEYMSPEQARGNVIDGRSDQYSLAIVAYEMLTGSTPFHRDVFKPWAIINEQISTQPPDPRDMRCDLSDSLVNVLMKALSKDPQRRFSSCEDFAQALTLKKQAIDWGKIASMLQQKLETGINKLAGGLRTKAIVLPAVALFIIAAGFWLVIDHAGKTRHFTQQKIQSQTTTTILPEKIDQPDIVQAPTATSVEQASSDIEIIDSNNESSDTSEINQVSTWSTYQDSALGFSIDRPDDWSIEQSQNGKLHTTIFKAPIKNVSIRIDAMVDIPETDPIESWEGIENRFIKAYGSRYQRISMDYSTLGGIRSATWLFTLQKRAKPVMKKVDIGGFYNGTGYAVLCTAPADSYDSFQSSFNRAINSFQFAEN